MASVSWSDTVGSGTLQPYGNISTSNPASRFKSWEPFAIPFGDAAHELGSGIRHLFAFRTDYGAKFEIRGIRNVDVDLAMRLQEHLLNGGTIVVSTDDSLSSVYNVCGLQPETIPQLTLSDPELLEYTLQLSLINVDSTPVPMICEY